MASTRTAPRDAEATRQRLLRAALELYTTEGYRAATTERIASRAGVAEGTIYRHFRGKEELFNEAYRGALRWGHGLVEELAADRALGARDLLDRSALARRLFGDAVVDHYVNAADVEITAFDAAVTDWERRRGFERL